MDDNDKTLRAYDDHIQDYIATMPETINEETKAWIDYALKQLPNGTDILELGSGAGRDADYIEHQGYKVMRTDAAEGFVRFIRQQGHDARLLNALTGNFGTDISMIFADAVLLHFSEEETKGVLQKAFTSLKQGGLLVFSVKQGQGENWSNEKIDAPRYFRYWQKGDLQALLTNSGFRDLEIFEAKSRSASWFQVIAKK